MSDADALFAAVLVDPADDLPRLVFADWLDDHGRAPRAAYIRLQIALERFTPGSAEWFDANRQLADLRDRFQDEWDFAFADRRDWYGFKIERRRGFVTAVETDVRRLLELGARMFAAAPVTTLRLVDPEGGSAAEDWQGLAKLAFLNRVTTLRLGPRMTELAQPYQTPPLTALEESKHLAGLRRLELAENGLDDSFVVRFVRGLERTAFAGSLAELDLRGNWITAAGANTLATAPAVERLTVLDVRQNRINPDGAQMLRARFGDRVRI